MQIVSLGDFTLMRIDEIKESNERKGDQTYKVTKTNDPS